MERVSPVRGTSFGSRKIMTIKVLTAGLTEDAVEKNIHELVSDKVASRIFGKDSTLWGDEAEAESSIRLGWVHSALDSEPLVEKILALREEFKSKGVNRFVLCGMGGSSLAPEVITATFGVELTVLDSTNPEQVASALVELERTAIIVSSKSGSTVETDSQKRVFEQAFADAGIDKTDRIVIVTDPGSPMEAAAKTDGYRVFNADPTVGGRYSALTAFGLVPSGLAGADIQTLVNDAKRAAEALASDEVTNPGLVLGAAMASTASSRSIKNKLVIAEAGTEIHGFGDWAEQLIAESTGKDGKGILPVVAGLSSPEVTESFDDVLVARVVSDALTSEADQLVVSGSLGEQFLLWEVATVVASRIIGINPFDQPDVESAKIAARAMLTSRDEATEPNFTESGIEVRAIGFDLKATDIRSAIAEILSNVPSNGYVALHAYLDRISNPAFSELRDIVASTSERPTTFGWGPRFLHSTGQFHKGGPAVGVFIQLVSKAQTDLAVPGRDFTFGELIASQAAGDAKVLADHQRPVLTITFEDNETALKLIKSSLEK